MAKIIKAEIKGGKAVIEALENQPKLAGQGVLDALEIIGRLLLNRASAKILKGNKSGIIYRRRGRTHQASAKGEAPASDTGKLVGSGEMEIKPEGPWLTVSFSAFYARMLEWGTRFMKRRPFLLPTLDESRAEIVEIMGDAIVKRLKK